MAGLPRASLFSWAPAAAAAVGAPRWAAKCTRGPGGPSCAANGRSPALELRFQLHQLLDGEPDLRLATELGTELLLRNHLEVVRVRLGGQRHVLDLSHQRIGVLHVIVDELL